MFILHTGQIWLDKSHFLPNCKIKVTRYKPVIWEQIEIWASNELQTFFFPHGSYMIIENPSDEKSKVRIDCIISWAKQGEKTQVIIYLLPSMVVSWGRTDHGDAIAQFTPWQIRCCKQLLLERMKQTKYRSIQMQTFYVECWRIV